MNSCVIFSKNIFYRLLCHFIFCDLEVFGSIMSKLLIGLSGKILEKLEVITTKAEGTDIHDELVDISENLKELGNRLRNLNFESEQNELKPEEVGLKNGHKLKELGSGKFGSVYKSEHKGCPVAVKLSKKVSGDKEGQSKVNLDFKEESQLLRSLRHPNIIAHWGSGVYNEEVFIVMEYIEGTLKEYIRSTDTDDGSGLSAFLTWHISKQIANGMDYLHSQGYNHGDLRPENILMDTKPLLPIAKLCDFGLSCHSLDLKKEEAAQHHVRWYGAPDGWDTPDKRDVFAFGLIVVMLRTGKGPWDETSTMFLEPGQKHETKLKDGGRNFYIDEIRISSDSVGEKINNIIRCCCSKPDKCPSFQQLVADHLSGENPFKLKENKGEFFSCGFLMNTNIFVADSVVKEDDPERPLSAEERFNGPKPTYNERNLLCFVDKDREEEIPIEEELEQKYTANMRTYKEKAKKKEIDDNPNIALKMIILDREGEDETQHIELRYKQSTYCHHRAIRDIWRGFDEEEKNKVVPCKDEVNKMFSTSFGLHIAVLTNEGNGKRKFIFTQRSRAKGVASPGAFTCGAVESCSVKDYVKEDSCDAEVSLVRTASRGLIEELGLELDGNDEKAIYLNTVYLKFDTHEWGMCGFIDLNDDRIQPNHRLTYEQVKAAFTSGSKDKFEHSAIQGVDFELKTMVEWIREHHNQMASSGKIAVVKVLQAYYGTALVSKEFEKYVPK